MRKTPIKRISKKMQAIKRKEKIQYQIMIDQSDGLCWVCYARRAVELSHTKDRKRFVPSCRECHAPDGVHRYLPDKEELENE